MGCTGLEGGVCVGNSHTGVVVEVNLNVAANDAAESADELIDLTRVRATNGISNTNTVHADAIDSLVDRKEVNQV